jgi:hypothetical protein
MLRPTMGFLLKIQAHVSFGIEPHFVIFPHAASGGDYARSRSIRCEISSNSRRRTTTSASWKHGIPAIAYDPGIDLHEFFAERRQGPVLDLVRQYQRSHEVGEVVSQRMELQPHRVVLECSAGKARPVDRVLAFLDPLLGSLATIAELHDPASAFAFEE